MIKRIAWATAILSTSWTTAAIAGEELVSSFELNNGMQIVVVEDHRAPVVHKLMTKQQQTL